MDFTRRATVLLYLPDGKITVHGEIVRCRALPTTGQQLGIVLTDMTPDARHRLSEFLFVDLPRFRADRVAISARHPLADADDLAALRSA